MFNKDFNLLTFGYSNLTAGDMEKIHAATVRIMSRYGVRVFGKEAHEILSAGGCEVNPETNMVLFPEKVINDCIEWAPSTFTMYARNPEKTVVAGGRNVVFTNFSAGVEVVDPYTGEKHPTTLKDLENIVRLMDGVDYVDRITLPIVATDVPEEIKDMYEAEALFNNTSKHFAHDTEGQAHARLFYKMASAVAGGPDKLKEKPIVSSGMCPNSPLEIHESAAVQVIEAARAGVPCNILSMGLCGGTTPVTLAGTLLTTNCEVLAGIVLSQLTEKGAPVFYGSSTTIMDLRLATSPVGAPEHAMIGAAAACIGKYYGIPTYVGGT